MNLPPQHIPIVDEPDESGRSLLLSQFWYGSLKQLFGMSSRAGSATDTSTLAGFTVGTLSAQWQTLRVAARRGSPGHSEDVLQITVPVTAPSAIGAIVGAHLYVENPDQSTGTRLVLDGSTPADGTAKLIGNWAPEDMGQQPYVAGQPFLISVRDATPGQQIRVYVEAYTDVLDPSPVQAGLTGATPSALVTVPDFAPSKIGNGLEYEPLISLVSVTTLTDDWSTGKRRTPVVVKVDTTSLPNPAPDAWACEVVLLWDNDPTPDPNAGKNIATGTFGVDEINLNAGVLPAAQDGIAAAHTLALDTPTSLIGLTVYVRSLKRLISNSNRGGTPQTRERLLRNTIVPGVTPSAHIVLGATDGTVDIGAALTNSISSEFHVVTVDGQKQLQMLSLDMTKAAHLSSQFVFDPELGVQKIAQLDAGVIVTGFLQVGGGGNKVSQIKIFDTQNVPELIGWIGDDSAASKAVGAWFKRCYIGGTSPATAKIIADSLGNVAISGSLIVGPVSQATSATVAAIFNGSIQATQVIAGQFTGMSMSLTKGGITTLLDNISDPTAGSFHGFKCTDNANHWYSIHDSQGVGSLAPSAFSGSGFMQIASLKSSPVNGGLYQGRLVIGRSDGLFGPGNSFTLQGSGSTGVTVRDGLASQSGFGQTTTVSYAKPGGGSGVLTFIFGWLVGAT